MDLVGISDDTASNYTVSTVANGSTMDKDDFLQLLVTQMKYQDPTEPMDNQELAAQLAQFSSLETLNNIQTDLEDFTTLGQSLNNSFMTNLIGKKVMATGDTVNCTGGDTTLQYNLDSAADVTITISDEDGNVVKTIDEGDQSAGDQTVTWDGTDNNGDTVTSGNYTFSVAATDSSGNDVTATTYIVGTVDGITYVDGSPYLVIYGTNVNLGNVISVLDNSSSSDSSTDSYLSLLERLLKQ